MAHKAKRTLSAPCGSKSLNKLIFQDEFYDRSLS